MDENKTSLPVANEHKKGQIACILLSCVAIGLYFVPYGWYALYPFMLIYTFVHEMGHGIAAEMMGGQFVDFKMWLDGSGVAAFRLLKDASGFAKAFVAFGGLIAPAIWAAIFLMLGRSRKLARIGLYLCAFICVASLILVVRNLFGFFFVAVCGLLSFGIAYLCRPRGKNEAGELSPLRDSSVPQYTMLFLAMTLCTCVFSRGDYLFTAVANTAEGPAPSDVAQIENNLLLPYWFWGGLIAVISVGVLIVGLWSFFKPSKKALEGDNR